MHKACLQLIAMTGASFAIDWPRKTTLNRNWMQQGYTSKLMTPWTAEEKNNFITWPETRERPTTILATRSTTFRRLLTPRAAYFYVDPAIRTSRPIGGRCTKMCSSFSFEFGSETWLNCCFYYWERVKATWIIFTS